MNKLVIIGLTVFFTLFFTKVTFFVVPPVAGFSEGETKLIWRLEKTQLVDSVDAICQREIKTINKVCQAATMTVISLQEEVIATFGYSQMLHKISMW